MPDAPAWTDWEAGTPVVAKLIRQVVSESGKIPEESTDKLMEVVNRVQSLVEKHRLNITIPAVSCYVAEDIGQMAQVSWHSPHTDQTMALRHHYVQDTIWLYHTGNKWVEHIPDPSDARLLYTLLRLLGQGLDKIAEFVPEAVKWDQETGEPRVSP